MDIQELIKKENERHREYLSLIEKTISLGIADNVSQFSVGSVFICASPFSDQMEILTTIRRTMTATMTTYHENGGCLAIRYDVGDDGLEILLFCTDLENALEKVSGGKCSLVETTHTETTVTCNI